MLFVTSSLGLNLRTDLTNDVTCRSATIYHSRAGTAKPGSGWRLASLDSSKSDGAASVDIMPAITRVFSKTTKPDYLDMVIVLGLEENDGPLIEQLTAPLSNIGLLRFWVNLKIPLDYGPPLLDCNVMLQAVLPNLKALKGFDTTAHFGFIGCDRYKQMAATHSGLKRLHFVSQTVLDPAALRLVQRDFKWLEQLGVYDLCSSSESASSSRKAVRRDELVSLYSS